MNGATHYDPDTASVYTRSIREAANTVDNHIRNGNRTAAAAFLDDIEKYVRNLRAEFKRS